MSQSALLFADALRIFGLTLSPLLLFPLLLLVQPGFARMAALPVRWIERLNSALLSLAGWSGYLMAIAMLIAVICRYVFGVSFGWLKDIWIYAFAACFLFASANALKSDGHVRVDIFYSQFSPDTKAIINLVGFFLFLLPLMILILHAYAPHLARAWGSANGKLELSLEPDGLPLLFLFKTLPPIFAITMILQGWVNSIRAVCTLKNIQLPLNSAPSKQADA